MSHLDDVLKTKLINLSPKALLAFDYDGVLAPITSDREAASVPPRLAGLLTELSLTRPCAILSGRARADVLTRLPPLARWVAVLGSHGEDSGMPAASWTERIERMKVIKALLLAWLQGSGLDGLDLEDKGLTIALHYRRRPELEERLATLARSIKGARVIHGKMVFDLTLDDSINKGTALTGLLDERSHPEALYVGDDATDEDVFELRDSRVLGIKVGNAPTAAPFTLPKQEQVEDLIRLLLSSNR